MQTQTWFLNMFFTKYLKVFLLGKYLQMSFTFLLALKVERFGSRTVWPDTQTNFGRYFLQDLSCKIQWFWTWCSVKRPASFNSGWFWTETGSERTKSFLKNTVEIVKKYLFSRQAFLFETFLNGKPLKNQLFVCSSRNKVSQMTTYPSVILPQVLLLDVFTCDDVMGWNFTLNNSILVLSYSNFLNFVFRTKSQKL